MRASLDFNCPQGVDLFVPQKTSVVLKGVTSQTMRDSFVSPSLVSAGGVIAAFAEGHVNAQYNGVNLSKPISSDVVAEYIESTWDWTTLVGKVNESTWKAHTVLSSTNGTDRVGAVYNPTTTTKGNKVFLLAVSFDMHQENGGKWKQDSLDLKLVVGEVTKSTGSEQSGWITWGTPTSLSQTTLKTPKAELKDFVSSGGSGVVMEDGTIVFSLMATNKTEGIHSMIIYSTDNGTTWVLPEGISPAKCLYPRITEWEGSLFMIVDCENGQRVYESRDKGTTWTETIGTLPGVWTKSKPEDFEKVSLHAEALTTATIEGRKVMLYTQRGYALGKEWPTALYLWVTDNNRTFSAGPVAMEDDAKGRLAGNLLHSDGNLRLLQRWGDSEKSVISLAHLAEELKKIKSVLSTWAQKDTFFSNLSIPTAGLVAVLSNTSASSYTWNDEYLCLNAKVKNAVKVEDGFQFTGAESGAMWHVNTRDDNVRHVFLSHNFTLVASVTIQETQSGNTLLAAMLGDAESNHTMGLSYTADKKWETVFEVNTTAHNSTWEPGTEYQVALMLQGNKASVYVDGQPLREEEEVPLTGKKPLELAYFCFGVCFRKGTTGQEPHVTVKNVFLYNRPLNSAEMSAIKDRAPFPTRDPESQVEGVPQTIASAVSAVPDPREVPAAAGATNVGRAEMTFGLHAVEGVNASGKEENTSFTESVQVVPEVSLSSAGRGLLPLLLLLGLWGLAAA
ncbi:trans-sialidase, putative [Trypanosoma cruzi marinkellei]|uniref:Trans-sialidase, putative n=1 Tax=Trypanosoma cruzi marinkellei TaxID=85056 RepID=K2NV91_TRYCR|nr:trans-sialidase, putative [Trypanosoma cruzi marinkellei]